MLHFYAIVDFYFFYDVAVDMQIKKASCFQFQGKKGKKGSYI